MWPYRAAPGGGLHPSNKSTQAMEGVERKLHPLKLSKAEKKGIKLGRRNTSSRQGDV